jgi:hypothetical protein
MQNANYLQQNPRNNPGESPQQNELRLHSLGDGAEASSCIEVGQTEKKRHRIL